MSTPFAVSAANACASAFTSAGFRLVATSDDGSGRDVTFGAAPNELIMVRCVEAPREVDYRAVEVKLRKRHFLAGFILCAVPYAGDPDSRVEAWSLETLDARVAHVAQMVLGS